MVTSSNSGFGSEIAAICCGSWYYIFIYLLSLPHKQYTDHRALTSQLLSVSKLAQELSELYKGLRNYGSVTISLNAYVHHIVETAQMYTCVTDTYLAGM